MDLCEHLGRADLPADARFSDARNRAAHKEELYSIFVDIFASKTLAEWKEILVTAKGAWSPVQTPEEIYDDPQTKANGFLRHVDYPDGGLKIPAPPVLFDEEAGDPPRAPDFAEHTDDVLRSLSYADEDIARLRSAGVIA